MLAFLSVRHIDGRSHLLVLIEFLSNGNAFGQIQVHLDAAYIYVVLQPNGERGLATLLDFKAIVHVETDLLRPGCYKREQESPRQDK